jgi:hypothetical protein
MRRANERQPAKRSRAVLLVLRGSSTKPRLLGSPFWGWRMQKMSACPLWGRRRFVFSRPNASNQSAEGTLDHSLLVHYRLAAIAAYRRIAIFLSQISTREPYQIDSPKSNTCHAVIGNCWGISSAAIGSQNLRLFAWQSRLPACRCSCTVCRDAATARHRMWLTANKRCLGPIVSRQRRATSRVRADMSRDHSVSLISRHSDRIVRRVSRKRDAQADCSVAARLSDSSASSVVRRAASVTLPEPPSTRVTGEASRRHNPAIVGPPPGGVRPPQDNTVPSRLHPHLVH